MSHRSTIARRKIGFGLAALAAAVAAATGVVPTSGRAPVVSAQAPTAGCVVDLTGMLGWWRGEDDLLAQVGPDLAGIVDFDSGFVGRAPAFGPSSDVSTAQLPAAETALTIEMWVKPTDNGFTGRTQALATRWDFPSTDDSARAYSLTLDPLLNLVFETDETSTRRPEVLTAAVPTITNGQFHHVAATWDSSELRIYFDGALVATKPSQRGILNPTPATPFRLGAKSGLGSPFRFDGVIDETSVWARALSAAEIGGIENRSSLGKCDLVPVEQAKLSSASTLANDNFGTSVAVQGSTSVIGAPQSSRFAPFDGSVYVFTGSGSTWAEQARLSPADPTNSTFTGASVDIDGDTIIAGSDGSNAPLTDSGAAYVFLRSGTSWAQEAKLVASDAAIDDRLGYAVAIDGDTAVATAVGDDDNGSSSGAAYVFVRGGGAWTQQAKLVASDGAVFDSFGTSVAVDGDTIVVGAAGDNLDPLFNAGSAYVFTRSGTTWTEQAKLSVPTPAENDQAGFAVTLEGDVVALGAPFADPAGDSSGAVHAFRRVGTVWSHEAQVLGVDTAAGDRFGTSVATNGTSIVVGSPRDGAADSQRGSAYVFNRVGSAWSEVTKLVPGDNDVGDQFGISVSVSGSILVGSHNDDDAGNNSGSAYLFAP